MPPAAELRRDRMRLCFGDGGLAWDEEKVLERYELLYEAGLVQEAARDGGKPGSRRSPSWAAAMLFDHRRILATAIARLRGKMKYRPVVFELMAPSFTLLELQRTVEALVGHPAAQAEFPPPGGRTGPGGRHRKIRRPGPRPAGRTVPLPPRSAARTPRAGRQAWYAARQTA